MAHSSRNGNFVNFVTNKKKILSSCSRKLLICFLCFDFYDRLNNNINNVGTYCDYVTPRTPFYWQHKFHNNIICYIHRKLTHCIYIYIYVYRHCRIRMYIIRIIVVSTMYI